MMRPISTRIFVGLLLFMTLSCQKKESDLALLQRCESYLYSHPELALTILDSIQFPEEFSKDHRYRYLLCNYFLTSQLGYPVVEERQQAAIAQHFIDTENREYVTLSEFCNAILYEKRGKMNEAGLSYQKALQVAEQENTPLYGMILSNLGQLQLKQSKIALAIQTLNKAVNFFRLSGDVNREAAALLRLSDCFEQNGDFSEAKRYKLLALTQSNSPEQTAATYKSLSELSYLLNEEDSAMYYAGLLQQTLTTLNNPIRLSDNWMFLMNLYQLTGNPDKAELAQARLNTVLNDVFTGKRVRRRSDESEKLKQIRSTYQTRIQSGNYWMNGTIVLSMLVILMVLLQNKRHRKKLQEYQSTIGTLQAMATELEQKGDSLRQLALKHVDVLKKVALLDGMMNDLKNGQEKKMLALFNQAVYENHSGFDWDTFFKSLNLLKNGIPQKVRQQYPQLTETEYRILILSFSGLSNKETSIILNLSTNTINSHRSSIRKKLNIPEYGDLEAFVTDQLT